MTLVANSPYLSARKAAARVHLEVVTEGEAFSQSASGVGNLRLARIYAMERARRRFADIRLLEPLRDNGDPADREAVEAASIADLLR